MSVFDASSASGEHPLVTAGVQLMGLLTQHLQARATADESAVDEEPRQRRRRGLEDTCRALAEQNELVAGAVGACACWGSDDGCPTCAGQGRPGTLPIDPAAFATIVAPLVAARPDLFRRPKTSGINDSRRPTTYGGHHNGQ